MRRKSLFLKSGLPGSVLSLLSVLLLLTVPMTPPAEAQSRRQARQAAEAAAAARVDPALFTGLEYRLVGPSRGGRSTTVTGVSSDLKSARTPVWK